MNDLQKEYIKIKRQLFDKYYDFLNTEQRRAVFHTDGSLLVLAGAGSGKTTVLVNRVGFIIKYGNAYHSEYVPADVTEARIENLKSALSLPHEQLAFVLDEFTYKPCAPWNILAITFTKKAAEEIRTRLAVTLGDGVDTDSIWAGTFHSVCVRIIRKYAEFIGFKPDFSIYDTDNTKSLIKDILKELNIDDQCKRACNEISKAKNKLLTPEMYAVEVRGNYILEKIAEVYKRYQEKLVECNALDFDDIIMQAVNILSNNDDAQKYYAGKFKYVCVDEFQDTNEAQLVLTDLLSSVHKNVMVVGDDDQSIYKFRGAVVENIINFSKRSGTYKIELTCNYRSTSNILEAANKMISHNENRLEKTLSAHRNFNQNLELHKSDNDYGEAEYVCRKINELIESGKYRYRDIAVLYRINKISEKITASMGNHRIPHIVYSGRSFYEKKEIKDILSYLYVLINPYDEERIKRIINIPKRGIGEKTVKAVFEISHEQKMSPMDIMLKADEFGALSRSMERLKDFASLIVDLRNKIEDSYGVSELIDIIGEDTGYYEFLKETTEYGDWKENITTLCTNMASFFESSNNFENGVNIQENDPYISNTFKDNFELLREFLEHNLLSSNIDKSDDSLDAVQLMTIHSAKGLEFPIVFLPAMEEGIFPDDKKIDADLEEERRLAYVALTRAKDNVYISYASYRKLYGNSKDYTGELSRFVTQEIPQSLINIFSKDSDIYSYMPQRPKVKTYYFASDASDSEAVKRHTAVPQTNSAPRQAQTVLSVGDRVRHRVFGDGEIFSVKVMGADVLYEVVFDDAGTKKLMGSFAKLKKI